MVDTTGPHPASAKGNIYVLTAIDRFSKWVEMVHLRNQETTTVAKIMVDKIICVHGCLKQILTDQGPNFESQLFQELCRLLSGYRQNSNGLLQARNQRKHRALSCHDAFHDRQVGLIQSTGLG